MSLEQLAEKIVPATILAIIGGMFTMYMDVEFLKATAIDYKERADKLHEKQSAILHSCEQNDIIHTMKLDYLLEKK